MPLRGNTSYATSDTCKEIRKRQTVYLPFHIDVGIDIFFDVLASNYVKQKYLLL